ncbi:hypothetical protein NQ318_011661 [Aromia moschata]|uniref:DUF4817 domain-containing protein n=1 Tax=Aromia moschata TaxID=1265417 RepID=A0AAV8Y3I2_9CUCU|nr:hypothetical protein NQ318_011661 [Aromia moschata]
MTSTFLGNARLSVRVYGERFPNRRLPNHTTFTAVVRRLRETGRFAARTADYGRNRFVRTADGEEEILARVEADPELSTRRIGAEMEISKDVVHRTLKEQLLHPYHKTPVQDLLIQDPGSRMIFCRAVNTQRQLNENLANMILFTDEACFTRRGITNFHNEHVYADENPHQNRPNGLEVISKKTISEVELWRLVAAKRSNIVI